MSGFGGELDAHLEAPYVDATQAQADYEAWCERVGFDPVADHWDAYEESRRGEFE